MEIHDLYKQVLEKKSIEHQTLVLSEECSELIKACCKMARGNGDKLDVLEEVADVQIMIEQICQFYEISRYDIAVTKCKKIRRLETRLITGDKL